MIFLIAVLAFVFGFFAGMFFTVNNLVKRNRLK